MCRRRTGRLELGVEESNRNDRVEIPADGAVRVCERSHKSEELNGQEGLQMVEGR